jgi:hypothetical protein
MLVIIKSMKYVNLLMVDVGWWIIYAMVAPVMLVRVKLLLMATALLLIPIALVPILTVTVGIRLLPAMEQLQLLVLTPPSVVITTTGKQQCNIPLPI